MKIEVWPEAGDSGHLGDKAQGLIDLAQMGLPVPSALILRGDVLAEPGAVRLKDLREAAIEQVCRFLASLEGSSRAVSLRCAAKGRSGGRRILPESVLDLGMTEAAEDSGASEAVCAAHAAAFFAFFSHETPVGFARLPLRLQLDALMKDLFAYLSSSPALDTQTPRTVVVQQMVYGDRDPRSLTGVCYTRHPHTGAMVDYGHFIVGRQGMALGGVDDPAQRDLSEMAWVNPAAYVRLKAAFPQVEAYHQDVRQLEFTAEGEALFLLQNTSGNRSFRLRERPCPP